MLLAQRCSRRHQLQILATKGQVSRVCTKQHPQWRAHAYHTNRQLPRPRLRPIVHFLPVCCLQQHTATCHCCCQPQSCPTQATNLASAAAATHIIPRSAIGSICNTLLHPKKPPELAALSAAVDVAAPSAVPKVPAAPSIAAADPPSCNASKIPEGTAQSAAAAAQTAAQPPCARLQLILQAVRQQSSKLAKHQAAAASAAA